MLKQEAATKEKFTLEEAQRKGHRERKEQGVHWVPKLFEQPPDANGAVNRWVYKYTEYVIHFGLELFLIFHKRTIIVLAF